MTEKKIVVPEGMLKAACGATRGITTGQWAILRDGLEAALLWLSGQDPTQFEFDYAYEEAMRMSVPQGNFLGGWAACVKWQRNRFLAPDPEIPEEIKDLFMDPGPFGDAVNKAITEAYRRGKAAKQ